MRTTVLKHAAAVSLLALAVASAQAAAPRAGIPTDREMDEAEAKRDSDARSAAEDGVAKGTALGKGLWQTYESWDAMTSDADILAAEDLEFDPDLDSPDSPQIPSACAESEECNACYQEAVDDINFYRFSFDKGYRITHSTLQYAKSRIAFGDTASAAMDVGGLAWSLDAKPEIEKAMNKIRATYQRKYEEWLAGLEVSLKDLGECEGEHFGERDWYGRFGYIYYSFMADRYKSPE